MSRARKKSWEEEEKNDTIVRVNYDHKNRRKI